MAATVVLNKCYITVQNGRKKTIYHKPQKSSFITTVYASGTRTLRGRSHTVQWIPLGFRLTNSVAVWTTRHGITRRSKSISRHISTTMTIKPLKCLIYDTTTCGKFSVSLLYTVSQRKSPFIYLC